MENNLNWTDKKLCHEFKRNKIRKVIFLKEQENYLNENETFKDIISENFSKLKDTYAQNSLTWMVPAKFDQIKISKTHPNHNA